MNVHQLNLFFLFVYTISNYNRVFGESFRGKKMNQHKINSFAVLADVDTAKLSYISACESLFEILQNEMGDKKLRSNLSYKSYPQFVRLNMERKRAMAVLLNRTRGATPSKPHGGKTPSTPETPPKMQAPNEGARRQLEWGNDDFEVLQGEYLKSFFFPAQKSFFKIFTAWNFLEYNCFLLFSLLR